MPIFIAVRMINSRTCPFSHSLNKSNHNIMSDIYNEVHLVDTSNYPVFELQGCSLTLIKLHGTKESVRIRRVFELQGFELSGSNCIFLPKLFQCSLHHTRLYLHQTFANEILILVSVFCNFQYLSC